MPDLLANRRSLLLVHDLPTTVPAADTTIALTPIAYDGLLRRGIDVSVLDDHLDRVAVMPDVGEYLSWQLDWIRRIDAALGGTLAARTAAFILKIPTDSLVVQSRLMRVLIEGLRPDCVRYVGQWRGQDEAPWHRGHLQFWPTLGDSPLRASVAELAAAALDLPFSRSVVEIRHHNDVVAPGRLRQLRSRLGRARQRWRLWADIASPPQPDGAVLLLWEGGFGIEEIAAGHAAAGRRLLVLGRSNGRVSIHRSGALARRLTPQIGVALPSEMPDLDPTLDALVREVDEWATVPGAHQLLRTRFRTFVHGVCPVIDHVADQLIPAVKAHDVREVVCATASTIEEFAGLLAARRAGIPATLIQHGDQLPPMDAFFVDFEVFDRFVVSDAAVAEELEERGRHYDVRLPSLLLDPVRARRLAAKPRRLGPANVVCYVASIPFGENGMPMAINYDDTWYHRWSRRVLDLMARHSDTTFLWKSLDVGGLPDPLRAVIAERGLANVRYETRFFTEVAGAAGRVVIDYPGTPIFEAVALGVPMLALSFSRFLRLRPVARTRFGRSLVECASEDDAIQAIDRFLAADAADWVVDPEPLFGEPLAAVN